ncbi:MAG: hypothetical protein ACFFCV_11670 [Promethearchaeota archaeon]
MEMSNKKKYHCPRCKNENIVEFANYIHCPKCTRDFEKELLGTIDDEYILSRQEMGGFLDGFTDKEKKKLFEKKL